MLSAILLYSSRDTTCFSSSPCSDEYGLPAMIRSAAALSIPGKPVSCDFDAEFKSTGLSALGRVSPSRTPSATALALSFSSAVACAVFSLTCSGLCGLLLQAVSQSATALRSNADTIVRMGCEMRIESVGLMHKWVRKIRKGTVLTVPLNLVSSRSTPDLPEQDVSAAARKAMRAQTFRPGPPAFHRLPV